MRNLTDEQRDIFINELRERTRQEAYCLKIEKDKKPGLFDSKFGGLPYWDSSKPYPTDENGNRLILLAQINLYEIDDSRLPENGMLQFFISNDDMYGCDFDNQDVQKNFRVVYHEMVDYDLTEEDLKPFNFPMATSDSEMPLTREYAVSVTKKETFMDIFDYRFNDIATDVIKTKFGLEGFEVDVDIWEYLDDISQHMDEMSFSSNGHKIFGYPAFTQEDPRGYNEEYQYYDTLLFQMDSDNIDEEFCVIWGDCGVANFFINHKDLENKDFSKILYNWDCC